MTRKLTNLIINLLSIFLFFIFLTNTNPEKATEINNEYIVFFDRYLWVGEHDSFLASLIGCHNSILLNSSVTDCHNYYEIIPRNNPSTLKFPSDFAVIRVISKNEQFFASETQNSQSKTNNSKEENLIAFLSKKSEIKHIVPHKRFEKPNKGSISLKQQSTKSEQNVFDQNRDETNINSQEPDDKNIDEDSASFLESDTNNKRNDEFQNHQNSYSYSDYYPSMNGRMTTKWINTFEPFDWFPNSHFSTGRKLLTEPLDSSFNLFEGLEIEKFWRKGYYGQGVRIGVFDTGLSKNHPGFENVVETINFSNELSADDELGHGTGAAGLIGAKICRPSSSNSRRTRDTQENGNDKEEDEQERFAFQHPDEQRVRKNKNMQANGGRQQKQQEEPDENACFGIAPKAKLHIFKVFTSSQVSYTSWFLDAFNYALKSSYPPDNDLNNNKKQQNRNGNNNSTMERIQIINLSIGGPDTLDLPFIEKIWELSANGIIIISASGNDGPVWGTHSNPSDLSNVIGVGGLDSRDNIAHFSSRGPTSMELKEVHYQNKQPKPAYGRAKPDIVTFSTRIRTIARHAPTGNNGNCQVLSGTSISVPIVVGGLALLISAIKVEHEKKIIKLKKERSIQKNNNNLINLRPLRINPGSMKQILMEGAQRLPKISVFEQGMGKLNLRQSLKIALTSYPLDEGRISFFPPALDFTENFLFPLNMQPLYYSSMPMVFNLTVLNGVGPTSKFESIKFKPSNKITEKLLKVEFEHPQIIWPYSGYLASTFSISEEGKLFNFPKDEGIFVEGTIEASILTIVENSNEIEIFDQNEKDSDTISQENDEEKDKEKKAEEFFRKFKAKLKEKKQKNTQQDLQPKANEPESPKQEEKPRKASKFSLVRKKVSCPVKIKVIETPDRKRRILWDQYHNLQYPTAGYVPRDNLDNTDEILDWTADHPHTNFLPVFQFLRSKNFFLEILHGDLNSFNAQNYGTLMLVDTEEEFTESERNKLKTDVFELGLTVLVFAEWHNVEIMKKLIFFDDNTHQFWKPVCAGGNLPALNGLLDPFKISFSDGVFSGKLEFLFKKLQKKEENTQISKDKQKIINFGSGTSILRFPEGGILYKFDIPDQTRMILMPNKNTRTATKVPIERDVPLLGFASFGKGRIAVFGDTTFLDSTNNINNLQLQNQKSEILASTSASPVSPVSKAQKMKKDNEFWLLKEMLHFAIEGEISQKMKSLQNGVKIECKAMKHQNLTEDCDFYFESPFFKLPKRPFEEENDDNSEENNSKNDFFKHSKVKKEDILSISTPLSQISSNLSIIERYFYVLDSNHNRIDQKNTKKSSSPNNRKSTPNSNDNNFVFSDGKLKDYLLLFAVIFIMFSIVVVFAIGVTIKKIPIPANRPVETGSSFNKKKYAGKQSYYGKEEDGETIAI